MILKAYYKAVIPKKKFKIEFEKVKDKRPAWIKVDGLPKKTNFIAINFGKKGIEGQRRQFYKTYLPKGLFLPINYTKEEMKRFYDKFANIYDTELTKKESGNKQNIIAAEFLLKKLKKYLKQGEMLDLGTGTGIITEMFVKAGYYPATLVDYSDGMLKKARKRTGLKDCKIIKADIRRLNLNKKFDLILSFFSFGSNSYFDKKELDNILEIPYKHLKKNGIFAVLGHVPIDIFKRKFKRLDGGIYDLSRKKRFYTDYFIGRKR